MATDDERILIRLDPGKLTDDAIDDYAEQLWRAPPRTNGRGLMPITLSQRYADAVARAADAHAWAGER